MDDLNDMAELHSAGATIRHLSPFDQLLTYTNSEPISEEFIQQWVWPYYMKIDSYY
jgi:hypothetical protein